MSSTIQATKSSLFILVDGSSYLYRAFHALPPLTNSKGQPTGAIYGVINMLKKLIHDYQPEFIAVVFDAKGKTFRDELFKQYKATRPPMPPELANQIQPLQAIIQAMGLPLLIIEGVEADDVIGTLAKRAEQQGLKTLISTGDKDMAQIVNNNITLINTMSNTVLTPQGVSNKFGIPPERIIDYLSLIGDKVDNIPGIPNVGPKTAVKWLTTYGSLDNIIENVHAITGKVGENLRNHLNDLPLAKQLVTLKLDVALQSKPEDLKIKHADQPTLIELFKQLEFKTWLRELLDQQNESATTTNKNYQMVLTEKDFNALLKQLKSAELVAFDTETTSLNYMQAQIVGLSFAIKPEHAYYVPVAHDYIDAPKQLDREKVLHALKPLLEDPKSHKVGQHLKYDKNVLANHGIDLQGIAFDSMLESYVLNSSGSRHDMDTLALKYLGKDTIHYEDVAGKGAKHIGFAAVPLETATPYAAEDTDITLQLHQHLWPQIAQDKKLKFILQEIEIPLLSVLAHIERNGVFIDKKYLGQQSQAIGKRLKKLEQEAFSLAGETFNLASPKQLQALLYTKLKLPIIQKTPKGQPSTAEAVLQELALDYPLPKVILEYRSLSKLKSTYTDTLPEQINPDTGRVHTSYHQAVVATGRLSSTDPNLQNIPIRTEQGRRIRQAFIAPPAYQIMAADYSQIELRIMAHLSADPGLANAFAKGLDIHKATAAEVFGVDPAKVSTDQRRHAKAINFGLIYGMSAYGLSRQLGIEVNLAKEYIELYFARYPGVREYMERTRQQAHQKGYVETLFGRRLYLPEIHSRNLQRQRAAERAAINAPMQGTAADIIKIAMIQMDAYLHKNSIDAKMIMQVHDELVFEVAEKDTPKLRKQVENIMCHAAKLSVPLVVDIGIGANWDEAH